ncbi:hypothetical protein [Actinophytocola sp.]|uniref:hypothetical protein n=1 Tax=Actinophytocola sp. TaxID=1872138 RepID=UPI003D6A5E8D
MPAMAETDELADLRAQLKRLEKRQARATGEDDRQRRLVVARMLVVIATVALFLALSMGWYADVDVDDEDFESASGWQIFTFLVGDDNGALVFGGAYSWVVVLAALAGGAAVHQLHRRWVAITLSTLLTLLTFGQLLINVAAGDVERLAGSWCALILMAAAAFAWGNLVGPLRELEQASLWPDR